MTISQRIFDIMENKHISQKQLSEFTGISTSAISAWKKRGANPAADTISTIADFLKVSVDYILTGSESSSMLLSDEELELITYYKKLPEKEQAKLISRAELLAEQYEEQQRKFELQRKQNIEYISRDRFLEKVSAGMGLYLFDDYKEPMDIEKNDTTIMTDYILTVSGDSMKPLYHNGDMLMVKYQPKVNIGEIGIFIVNGEGFVKRFGGDRIISLNPEYDDILLSENDSIYCQGKVLGVLDPKLTREYHETALSKA